MRPLFVLLLVFALSRGDEVVLTNGRRLSCEIVKETDTEIRVRLPHGVMAIPRSKIKSVQREASSRYLKREARTSLRHGATKSAVELLARAFAENPGDAAIRLDYARALLKYAHELVAQSRFDEARATLARLKRIKTGLPAPNLREERRRDSDVLASAALERTITREEDLAARLLARGEELVSDGRYRQALAYFDHWRVRRPVDDPVARRKMAAAHLGAGAEAAKANLLRLALDHYRAAHAFGERSGTRAPLFLLTPIAVLEELREGDAETARRLLDRIETTYPQASVPVYLEAVIAHVTGDVETAVKAYAAAARAAESETAGGGTKGISYDIARAYATATLRVAIARPPQEGVKKWRELFLEPLKRETSRHFIVFAPSEKTAAEIAATADRVYEELCRDLLGRVPDAPPAEIVAHPTRQAYLAADPDPPGTSLAKVTVAREQTSGVAYDTLDEKGKRLVRVELIAGDKNFLTDTLPHELVHVVQRRGLGAFRRGKWLDEGLAMLHESKESRANRLGMWRTLSRAAIPLPEFLGLKSIPPDKVALFYQQAHAFTTFLHELGDGNDWLVFLDRFGRDGDFAVAVKAAYKVESAEVLERLWLGAMRKLR